MRTSDPKGLDSAIELLVRLADDATQERAPSDAKQLALVTRVNTLLEVVSLLEKLRDGSRKAVGRAPERLRRPLRGQANGHAERLDRVIKAARALDAAMVDAWGPVGSARLVSWDAPAKPVQTLSDALRALGEQRIEPVPRRLRRRPAARASKKKHAARTPKRVTRRR